MSKSASSRFPVVGIGASAGGLDAAAEFLRALPPAPGMAFILVQHLDPNHESLLHTLLGKATSMPVKQAEDGVRVKPNHVYVIPPNKDLVIEHCRLRLSPRRSNGQHMPVDKFLQSLAVDQKANAISVILSGTASDGTVGCQAIKAEGGIAFAQDPKSAKHAGMPESAVAAGCVDFVLSPHLIAKHISQLAPNHRKALAAHSEDSEVPIEKTNGLGGILGVLHAATGVNFALYKPSTIRRRIARRLSLVGVKTPQNYLRYLKENPSEINALYNDIFIHVTSFFREPETFAALRRKVFPKLLAGRPREMPIRIWVPGCSTGEEAYSIAIALIEFLEARRAEIRFQLFGTDISEAAIQRARAGVYSQAAVADVSPVRLRRFFTKVGDSYNIAKNVREMCVFAKQDLAKDPPFSKLDLISCHNVLIYMGPLLHKRILSVFHYALKPNGFLTLGKSESLGPATNLFKSYDRASKIFIRNTVTPTPIMEFVTDAKHREMDAALPSKLDTAAEQEIPKMVEQLIWERYAPAAFVVDSHLHVLHFQGNTGPYLSPAAGAATLDLLKLVRHELALDLRATIYQARKDRKPVRKEGVHWTPREKESNKAPQERVVDIEAIPLKAARGRDSNFLVLIDEIQTRKAEPHRVGEARESTRLRHELAATREHLQSIIEGQEAANEEVRAANEEVLSANEELQSTNEELETAKEELQSSNEELTTLNEELQNRNSELAHVANDLNNLLVGVNIPVVILGIDRRIRRFTPSAGALLNLIPADVGRPIDNIRPNIEVPGLDEAITEVTANDMVVEKEVQDHSGRWYSIQMRPYKTEQNKIDGVLLAFVDIDIMKRSLGHAQQSVSAAEADRDLSATLLDISGALVIVRDARGHITAFNRAAEEVSGYSFDEIKGKTLWRTLIAPEKASEMKEVFEKTCAGQNSTNYESTWICKEGERRSLVWSSLPHRNFDGSVGRVISVGLDITSRKQTEDALRVSEERFRALSDKLRHFNAELRRANDDLNNFAYSASHDLQEPLRMVAIYSQKMQRKYQGKLDNEADQYLAFTLEGARRMERLVKSLLEYAQAMNITENGVAPVEAKPVLDRALSNLAAAIEETGATVEAGPLPTLLVEEVHLLQLFQNIVGNAIKYRSSAPPRVKINAERRDSMSEIRISDNGIGIAKRYADQIFGMFKRLHTESEHSGAGIGLATCKRIVERYGGRIWVESEEGKGSTFCFTLPADS